MLDISELGVIKVVAEGDASGHYNISQNGRGGSDIMWNSINGEVKPVATFDETIAAEEAYARAMEEAMSSANVIAIMHLEMRDANA